MIHLDFRLLSTAGWRQIINQKSIQTLDTHFITEKRFYWINRRKIYVKYWVTEPLSKRNFLFYWRSPFKLFFYCFFSKNIPIICYANMIITFYTYGESTNANQTTKNRMKIQNILQLIVKQSGNKMNHSPCFASKWIAQFHFIKILLTFSFTHIQFWCICKQRSMELLLNLNLFQ